MTLADIKKLPIFKSQAIAASEQADKGDTHNYIVDCLTALFYGDYGNVPQEDTDANNNELVAGEGRIVAKYDKKYSLLEDIYIVALFSQSNADRLGDNRIMILYDSEY